MKEARLKTAVRQGTTISQGRMAELVGAALGRTMHQTQWSHYEVGRHEPPLDVIEAVAVVSGLSPAYIAFGIEGTVEDFINPLLDRKLTEEEIERARRAAAAAKAERTSPAKRRRRGA